MRGVRRGGHPAWNMSPDNNNHTNHQLSDTINNLGCSQSSLILTSILTNTSYIQRSRYLLGLSAFTHLLRLKLGWLSAKIFAYQRLSKTTMYKHQLISKILNRFFQHESIIEGEGQTLCIYHSIEVRKVLDLSNTIQLNIITQRWRMESMYFIPVLFRGGLTEQIA